jgi:hypothetical protein
MAIPLCGTFDYVAVVPDRPGDQWDVRLREPVKEVGSELADSRLVGFTPQLQITDAGLPRFSPPARFGIVYPKVLRSRVTLTAPGKRNAQVSAASFHVDKALTSVVAPGDTLHMARTACGGLGLSVIRRTKLLFAVGAVTALPLGADVEVRLPVEAIREAQGAFQKRDPQFTEFQFAEWPLEIRIGSERRLTQRGRIRLGGYEVNVFHGFLPGLPGEAECVSLVRTGECSDAAANASALLLDGPQALEILSWS